jgi:hypothetical protein
MAERVLPSRRVLLITLIAALAGLVIYTWLFHDLFTSKVPGANDFFSRWGAAHLYFTKGWNPYGDQTSLWMQTAIYGRAALPTEDASLFAYPFYTIFLVAPYTWLPDYAWAQAAWQVTLQITMMVSMALLLMYLRWKPSPLMLGGLALWTIFFYPTLRSILLGQIGVMVFALTLVALWLMWRGSPSVQSDALSGVLLAISTVKPHMQFLIIPLLLIWAIRQRRWWMPAAFSISMVILMGVSFLLLPGWLVDWLGQIQQYPGYTPPAVLTILTREILPPGTAAGGVELALGGGLLAYWLVECWRVLWRGESHRLDWLASLTLVITHLVAPRTATTHFIVFLLPLYTLFHDLSGRGKIGAIWNAVIMLGLGIGMWWLFLATVIGNQEANLVHVPLPLLMFGLMLATRPAAEARSR